MSAAGGGRRAPAPRAQAVLRRSLADFASRSRVPLGFVLAAIFVVRARPTPWSLAIGLPIAAAGLLLRAAASGHIHKNDALAVTGPYRHTRNPLYLGSAILAAGFVIAAADWLMAVLAALMLFGIYLPVIRREELYLATRFGPEFEAFQRAVPRFWPRLKPGPAVRSETGFSWQLYRRHREYNALLGFTAIAAIVILKWLCWRSGPPPGLGWMR